MHESHLGVLDSLVDGKDQASRLRRRPERVSLVNRRLPHARFKRVAHTCSGLDGGGSHFLSVKVYRKGGCTQFVYGRSRMTIDPRIPTMPGRSTSGFHQPGRHCLHQARSAVRCLASRMKDELYPSKNRS